MKKTYQGTNVEFICLERVDVITASSGSAGNEWRQTSKKIVKTKIIATNEQETEASRKKGKVTTALMGGLLGVGGVFIQDSINKNHREMEQVVTFLVFYDDGSRETVDTTKDSDTYDRLIMYLE